MPGCHPPQQGRLNADQSPVRLHAVTSQFNLCWPLPPDGDRTVWGGLMARAQPSLPCGSLFAPCWWDSGGTSLSPLGSTALPRLSSVARLFGSRGALSSSSVWLLTNTFPQAGRKPACRSLGELFALPAALGTGRCLLAMLGGTGLGPAPPAADSASAAPGAAGCCMPQEVFPGRPGCPPRR